jgi:ABC-type glycerol-3-phosphate transport system substrate-binding protein
MLPAGACCAAVPITISRFIQEGTIMSRTWNRRTFTQASALAMGGLTARHLLPSGALAQAQPTATTSAPVDVGEGGTEITMWVQDHGASIAQYSNAAQRYVEKGNDVKVTVQPIAFADLLSKVLPSVAAGNEGDIMMGYTNFYVGTDITRLFLRLDEAMGGREKLDAIFLPASLEALDMPDGGVYYMPSGAGLNGAAVTVNPQLFTEAGIDYKSFATWEDLLGAAQQLTVVEGDKITRAGLNFSGLFGSPDVLKSWIWQLGGNFYDGESGTWSFASPEGEAALQKMSDVYNGASPVNSFDIITNDTDDMVQGRLASHLNGAYAISNTESLYPEFDADGFATPPLAEAVENVVYPAHMGVVTLSRRLADDDTKREHCLGIIDEMFALEYRLAQLDVYSGSMLDQRVYSSPDIANYKYGEISKSISDATFSRARYPKDHVANQDPARDELVRALRQEISITEALENADKYLNDQEKEARERIG